MGEGCFEQGMCRGPVAAALPFISAGVSILGGMAQSAAIESNTQAQMQAAQANQQADEYNAAIARQNVSLVQGQTQAELEKADRERRIRMGAAKAAGGASGIGSESFGDILQSSAAQEELDLLTIKSEGLLREREFSTQAGLLDASAASTASQIPLIKSAGSASKSAAIIGSVSSGLGGF